MTTTTLEYRDPMQRSVAQFHRAFHQPDRISTPGPLPLDRIELRVGLIREEGIVELGQAIISGSVIEMIDALTDTLYVSLGGLVEMGYSIDELAHDAAPTWPGISLRGWSTAARDVFDATLPKLESALRAGRAEESARLFSAIARDALHALTASGLDAKPFFDEVQRANMSKLGPDGKPVHSRGMELDGFPKGKALKGPAYTPPNLARVFEELYPTAQAV